ncbi:MAG: hypothetical protein WC387_00960, partial [Candidatus Paceibacterota bacterium]
MENLYKKIAAKIGTPVFVYEEAVLLGNVERIRKSASDNNLQNRIKVFPSYFCNSNPNLFKVL